VFATSPPRSTLLLVDQTASHNVATNFVIKLELVLLMS